MAAGCASGVVPALADPAERRSARSRAARRRSWSGASDGIHSRHQDGVCSHHRHGIDLRHRHGVHARPSQSSGDSLSAGQVLDRCARYAATRRDRARTIHG